MNNIAERIRNLIAKGRSTEHEGEAELYLAKAKELMEKYQLELRDLSDDPVEAKEGLNRHGGATPDWDFDMLAAVARFYGGRAVRIQQGRYRMEVIARQSAHITIIEMHKYLVATVRKQGREFAKRHGVKPDPITRRIGRALEDRLYSLSDKPAQANTEVGKNALITMDEVDAMFDSLYPDTNAIGTATRTSQAARKIAEGISLNLQTTASNNTRRLS